MKILVADDSVSVRQRVCTLLHGYGPCEEAADGREALERYRKALQQGSPYDVVIMDIVMPEMDGIAAARAVRELQRTAAAPAPETTIIMLSSKNDPEHMLTAHFETGATQYITKPFEDSTLIEAIENIVPNPTE